MSRAFFLLAALLPTTVCVAAAAYLLIKGAEGWGWFLFVALLLDKSVKFSKEGDK